MAQLVKQLLYTQQIWVLHPQNPWEELGMAALEKEVSGTSWLSSLVKSVSSEFCDKTCLKK